MVNIDLSPPGIHGLACMKRLYYLYDDNSYTGKTDIFALSQEDQFINRLCIDCIGLNDSYLLIEIMQLTSQY